MLPELGEIKAKRKQLGLTQSQLAVLAGVSQSLITKVEAGRLVPSYTNTKRILDVLEARGTENSVKAADVMTRKMISVKPVSRISAAVKLMKKHSVSQLPVIENGVVMGSFSEKNIVERLHSGESLEHIGNTEVSAVMGESMPIIQGNTPLSAVSSLLEHSQAVLISKGGRIRGIITKADLLGVVLMGQKRRFKGV